MSQSSHFICEPSVLSHISSHIHWCCWSFVHAPLDNPNDREETTSPVSRTSRNELLFWQNAITNVTLTRNLQQLSLRYAMGHSCSKNRQVPKLPSHAKPFYASYIGDVSVMRHYTLRAIRFCNSHEWCHSPTLQQYLYKLRMSIHVFKDLYSVWLLHPSSAV